MAAIDGLPGAPTPGKRWSRPVRPLASTPDETTDAGAEICILIVDDDPLMTDLLPRKLRRAMSAHVRILTATTPAEASALFAREKPDIILSDFNLRDIKTGLDVLADAARDHPRAARILFSGHTSREIGSPLAQADIHGYFEKPMKLDELVATLLTTLREALGLDLTRKGDVDGVR